MTLPAMAAAALTLALAGCATPTTGVVPLSDGLHKVTHEGAGAWVRTETLKVAAIREATEFCQRTSKAARVIDVRQREARPLQFPEAEVLFRCE